MAPVLNDYEYQFGSTLLNQAQAFTTADLPFVDVQKVTGLDSGEFRSASHDHEGVDGGYIDSEFLTMRTVVVEGTLYTDPGDPDTICDQLKYDFRPVRTEQPFYYKHPNKPMRMLMCKGQGAKFDIDALRRTGQTALQLQMIAPTPYIYDADVISGSGNIGTVDPGHGFNESFNMDFGGLSVPGNAATLGNAGNHEAYPIVTIYGQIDQPMIVDTTTGRSMTFNITLGATDWLTIDMRRHTVTLNDGVNRRNTVVGLPRWITIGPGVTTTLLLFGSANSSVGSVTATSNSADNVTIVGTDADASDVLMGNVGRLFTSAGNLKEATTFIVTGLASAGGFTTVTFSPGASAFPVIGDVFRVGGANFTASVQNTWY